MKKSLVALAALAATSAFAQSSVTIYGQADAAYTSVKSGVNSFTGLAGAGRGSNFLGFMGSEDLGGGLKANFKLEAQYNLDSGAGNASNLNNQAIGAPQTVSNAVGVAGTTAAGSGVINSSTGAAATQDRFSMAGGQGLTFNRWSYVGVSGGFGEIRAGREYTPTFQAVLSSDTTGANGVQNTLFQTLMLGQTNSVATTTSASNGISWESPRVSGVQVKYQKFYGENLNKSVAPNDKFYSGNSGDGNSYRLDYTQGPLSIGTSAQKTSGGTNAVVATTGGAAMIPGEYKVATTYAKYNFGPFTAGLSTVKENLVVANAQENKTTLIGLSYPVSGTVTINATMASSERSAAGTVDAKGKQTGLQALYALSKRTDLYANYASTTNGLGKAYGIGNGSGRLAAVDNNLDKSTAYQIGMRHSF